MVAEMRGGPGLASESDEGVAFDHLGREQLYESLGIFLRTKPFDRQKLLCWQGASGDGGPTSPRPQYVQVIFDRNGCGGSHLE